MEKEYIEHLRRAWQKRAEAGKKAREKWRREALEKAKNAAAYLRGKYKVDAVYLYGSLVWGKHFDLRSDIDLLVEGLAKNANYWRMLVELEQITAPWVVSVVLCEDADVSLREKVRNEGMLL